MSFFDLAKNDQILILNTSGMIFEMLKVVL